MPGLSQEAQQHFWRLVREDDPDFSKLDLHEQRLAPDFLLQLGAALKTNKHLSELNLSSLEGECITNLDHFTAFLAGLASSQVVSLSLANNVLSSDHIKALGGMIQHTKVRHLDLSQTSLSAPLAEFIAFLDGLASSQVVSLSLASNVLPSTYLVALAARLTLNQVGSLKDLDLSNISLTLAGWFMLLQAMTQNTTLESLTLNFNPLPDMEQLTPSLTVLGKSLFDFQALFQEFFKKHSLKLLSLASCNLRVLERVFPIPDLMKSLSVFQGKHLKELNLSFNQFGFSFLLLLFQQLRHFPNQRTRPTLYLYGSFPEFPDEETGSVIEGLIAFLSSKGCLGDLIPSSEVSKGLCELTQEELSSIAEAPYDGEPLAKRQAVIAGSQTGDVVDPSGQAPIRSVVAAPCGRVAVELTLSEACCSNGVTRLPGNTEGVASKGQPHSGLSC